MWRVEVHQNGRLDHYLTLDSREQAIQQVTTGNRTARVLGINYRYVLAY